jgi:hypothetical protein
MCDPVRSRVALAQHPMRFCTWQAHIPLVCVTVSVDAAPRLRTPRRFCEDQSSLLSWDNCRILGQAVLRLRRAAAHFPCCGIRPLCRWYGPVVPKSRILPVAAAVTAVALSAAPAQATPLLAGKRDDVKVVAFPLLAVKGQMPAGVEGHVSHSSHQSHVSGSGGHVSHVSHHSHVSSVPAPVPTSAAPVATQPPPSAAPAPVASAVYSGGSSAAEPSSGSLASSSADLGSDSPATSNGGGCAFVIVAPVGFLARWIRRVARRMRAR